MITKKTTIEEVYKLKGGEEILSKYYVPCVSCPMARLEFGNLTLEMVCLNYGIDLDNLLKELNKLTENKSKSVIKKKNVVSKKKIKKNND
ncbi:MAG TPA: hypothetical protein PKK56_02295 [archaeon]|jgi:hypothetical protein|nr:hypothetical protein [archaeon]HRT02498.1 hypothetical protein [Candidatus Diapherotrites archaeon]